MKRIISFFRSRKHIKKLLALFRQFIKSGSYNVCVIKRGFEFFKLNNRKLFSFRRTIHVKGFGNSEKFIIKRGNEKYNFIDDDIVVSKYYIDVDLYKIESRIEKYLNKLVLPHNEYLEFSAVDNKIVAPFVKGESYFDEAHNKVLLNKLFNYSLKSSVCRYGDYLFYVQHGDAYGANIIWCQDGNFLSIDNEGVNEYPAFYDIFMLVSLIVSTPEEFESICLKNSSYFEHFCKLNNLVFDKHLIDNYLSLFVYFRMKSYYDSEVKKKHRPFLFLDNPNSANLFPKAFKMYNILQAGEDDCTFKKIYSEVNG